MTPCIAGDGIRNTDQVFQTQIDHEFENFIDEYKINCIVIG